MAVLLSTALVVGSARPVEAAQPPPPTPSSARAEPGDARPMPPLPYQNWDGKAGLPDITGDPRLRRLVADHAELSEDPEVRDAATTALAGDDKAIMAFLNDGLHEAKARAAARKQEQARRDKTAVEALRDTGGPIFNAEVLRVLAGSDSDRATFLAYGKDIARARDDQSTRDENARVELLLARVTALLAVADVEVKAAAQAALDGGPAAVDEFLRTGYLAAAKRDADRREQKLRDDEAKAKAAEELAELAVKSKAANAARVNLVIAHGKGLRALQLAANAMVGAANAARVAEQILKANEASGQHPPDAFFQVKAEADEQLRIARDSAGMAGQAAAQAQIEADEIVRNGFTHGTQWAQMAQGMSAAARAAVLASETARHAIVATEAVDQARNAQEKAEANARRAADWRVHAQQHARSADDMAKAANAQAVAARDAAARTDTARQQAEAAANAAWAAADRTRVARNTAVAERTKASAARAEAERERANAAGSRATAEQQAARARSLRGQAEREAAAAADARSRAEAHDQQSQRAKDQAKSDADNAIRLRDQAYRLERDQQAAEARRDAMAAWELHARGTAAAGEAKMAADEARQYATEAATRARQARDLANQATGAAVLSSQAAAEAERAAARSRAAAQRAASAAAAANAAANRAEQEAAATHKAASEANAKASEATFQETRAAEAATAAGRLAEQAATEAVRALWAADRTKAEAEEAAKEAVNAATQAGIAIRASMAARESSAAITDPANTAISVVAPFTGADIDADFVALVAEQAKKVGAEQAKAAKDRADEAVLAAKRAADAAERAEQEVKPAFEAAAQAAASAAAAAQAAATAQQAAADAARHGAAARAAAARANDADRQARQDAKEARDAANAANNDAAIAGRNAAAAQRDAVAARNAATKAAQDAELAQRAADKAEEDARAADAAATRAEEAARQAADTASRARQAAIDAQKAADRAEEAARKAKEEQDKQKAQASASATLDELSEDELMQLLETGGGRQELSTYTDHQVEEAEGDGVPAFLKSIGAEEILAFIGWPDIKKCLTEGNFAACLWTVFHVASVGLSFLKIKKLIDLIAKVVSNFSKWLGRADKLRQLVDKVRSAIRKAKSDCDGRRMAPSASLPPPRTPVPDCDRKKAVKGSWVSANSQLYQDTGRRIANETQGMQKNILPPAAGCESWVVFLGLNRHDQAQGMKSHLCKTVDKGTEPSGWNPPGWNSKYHHRGHLLAKVLGGRGIKENLTSMYAYANTPLMRMSEREVQLVSQANDPTHYEAIPTYPSTGNVAPDETALFAISKGGKCVDVIITNEKIPSVLNGGRCPAI
ncbi:DNA/RNA non-specific endonuclease [Kibdelosporangium phytohabitans]|uniref:DNA/RNA non-specific endonuclease n=1 Tax=Kibdelosporangium phytohabitans TaxID=860235 RepID=UPI0014703205|nr:DNA/RNA non-specific endonuclease [Kibdelosporangium phytohabitans]MBE1470423.1 hypothetical protein [Kibdelosporangium phytohabitans]